MEYRCLIAGDAVAEPRMLLQRLLGVPVSESDRRHLRHRSLRDVLLCRATYALLGTATKKSKKGQHGEGEGDEKGALAVNSAEHNNNINAEDTRQAFAAGPFTLTMPNPSMPSVDVTILLDLVESPAELEAILRPELPAHGPIAALARTTCMAKRQRFHSAHAVVFAFNRFSHDSVDRARFAWTAALRRCRGALAMNTTAREASLPPYNTTHSAFYDYNAEGNGSAGTAPATAATSSGRYKGDVSALSLCSPSFPVSAMAAMNWATPPHTADHYSNTNNNGNQHLTRNDDGGDDAMASAALAPRRFDPMAGDIVPYGGACGPTVLLVGTRFDLLAQAVAATPTVMPPAPPTLAQLAADMGACLYFEVADTWPERLAELRTRLAQACVGELQERALRVRLEDVSGVRQASMQRAFCELHLSEQDSMAIEGAAEAVAAPEDNRDEELAVSFAWSAQLSFAGPPPANTTTNTERATTRAAAVQEVMSGASQRTQAQADAAQAQDTQHAATTDTAHDAAREANGADDARRLRSVWTWRRHPRTGRVYFVHRPTRRTQYSRPPDYDGREPPAAQVSSPSPPSPSYTAAADKRHDALAERKNAACAEDTVEAQAGTRHHTRQAVHRTSTTRNEARHHSSHAAHKGKKDKDEDDGEAAALTSHTGHTPGHTRTARPPSSQAPSSPATTVLSIVASTPPAANNHNAATTTAKVVRALLLSSPTERSVFLQSEEAAAAAAAIVGGGETKGVVSALACLCAAEVRARVALLHALEKGCDEECDGVLHDLQHEVDALRDATRGVPHVMPSTPEDAVGHLHSACADSANVSDQATRSLHEAAAAAQLARYESALCVEEQAAQDALRAARWRYDVWADRLDTQCLVASTRVTRRVPHDAAEHGVSAQASTPHANATRDAVVHALCDGVYAAYRLQRAQEALQQTSRVPASPPITDAATPEADGEAGAVPAEYVRRVLHEMHESGEGNAHETGSLLSADVLPEAWQRWLIRALQAAALALVRQSSKKQRQQQQSSQCATRTSESAQSGTTTTTTPSLDASRYGGVVPLDALQARRAMQEQKVSLWCALRAALRERSEAPPVNSEANREDGHRAFAAAFARHAAQLEEAIDGGVVST